MSEADKKTESHQRKFFPDTYRYSPKELRQEFDIRLPRRTEYQRMFTLEEARAISISSSTKKQRSSKPKDPCDGCSLKGHKKVLGIGDLNTAKVIFIGEAPGQEEEKQEKAFVGRAGQLLRKRIIDADIDLKDCCFRNVLRCRPPDNRTPTKQEVKRCVKYLRNELVGVKGLIVLLGGTAIKAFVGRTGVHNNRGYGFFENRQKFFATYHPAFILRDESKHNYDKLFKKDLKKVKIYVDLKPKMLYNIIKNEKALDRFISIVNHRSNKFFKMSFDIETNVLSRFSQDAKILTMAFSFGPTKDENWLLPLEHSESPFKDKISNVIKKLVPLFKSKEIKLVGHGGDYDIEFLNKRYGITTLNYFFDTTIAHFLLKGKTHIHKLKSLAWQYTDYGGYDVDRNEIGNLPLNELADYNMSDAYVTRRLMRVFWKLLTKKQHDLLTNTICPAVGAIAEIENTGMFVNEETRQSLESKYLGELSEIETRMHSYPEVVEIETEKKAIINFNSSDQLRELFERIDVHPTRRTKKRKVVSTDKRALDEVKSKHPVIQDLLDYSTKEKILSTYLLPYKDRVFEGKVHGNYSFIITATGRLACSKPNLQNIPYIIRSVFVSDLGYLLATDYSQLELRVLAAYSKDENLVSGFLEGFDVHEKTRFEVFGDNSKLSKFQQTKQRVAAKTINFGIVYGVTPKGLSENLAEAGVNVSQKRAGETIDIFYNTYPGVAKWQEEVWEQVKAQGYYETFFGRRRMFNLDRARNETDLEKMRREAINTPIQGTASDLVVKATGNIWKAMRCERMKVRMIGHVHDEVLFDVPEEELEQLIKMIPQHMESFDYDWLNVPIKVDISIGTAWGKLEEF